MSGDEFERFLLNWVFINNHTNKIYDFIIKGENNAISS
jgi:hypothetical protein